AYRLTPTKKNKPKTLLIDLPAADYYIVKLDDSSALRLL
ncbi:unnamed protein product, partial [marine sediment metagenome]